MGLLIPLVCARFADLCANSCAPWLLFYYHYNGSVKTCSVKNSQISTKRAHPSFGLLVTSPLHFKARVDSHIRTWWRCACYMFPEINLWCNTCQPLGGKHGKQAILFRVSASRHWWGSKREYLMFWDTPDKDHSYLSESNVTECWGFSTHPESEDI